jgi:CheY-like chemotaxis protein
VVTVESGSDAVEIVRERADDVAVVLLDVMLTGLDSVSTLERLRAIRPDLAAILMSGRPEDEATHDFVSRSVPYHRFLQKPFATAQLSEVVGAFAEV